jgi:hypothetical protein
MNTAEQLETITDAGKFERLATLILRKADGNYKAIIQHGINAKGQPIASPTDGFCLIPGSDPPHFLWVQHTTTSRANLRTKWLDEKDGDLIKAWQQAQDLNNDFPDARFRVILSTNQRIPTERSESNLLDEDVYREAQKLGLTVVIWEQSQYADFLDGDRDGQWLRKEFFGTDAQMLSPDLLVELSQKSLATYKDWQFTDPDNWIARQVDGRISQRSDYERQGIVKLLIGDPGFGKSAIAYSFLQSHIENGGYGLFIPKDVIENSISLEEAVQTTLNKLYPSLLSLESGRLCEFIPDDSQFVIVVDDINQTTKPQVQILKLANWARLPYLILCPVWPRFRPTIPGLESRPEIDAISVERMSLPEGAAAIVAVAERADFEVSQLDAQSIAGRLQSDPLLIGSFGELLRGASEEKINDLVENVIENLIRKHLAETADSTYGSFLANEYARTLSVLTSHMLEERKLYPAWEEIEAWFNSSTGHLEKLRQLCRHGKLCRVDGSQFRFQHDRVFYHFAVSCMIARLANISENADVLFDPHYAEVLGQALVKAPQSEAVIDEIRDKMPLALVSTVRHIGVPSSEYHRFLIRKVSEWIQLRGSTSSTPESIRGEVANSFINTDSPIVLELVNTNFGLEVDWLGDFARFRNGDARSALRYCSLLGGQFSGISRYQNSLWEDLVEHARRYHRERLVSDLMHMLESPDMADLKGLLVLIGFLALPELHDALKKKWEEMTNKSENLPEILWAAFRCSINYHEDGLLNSLISYWASPSDIDDAQLLDWQKSIASRIADALAFDADQQLIDYLIWQSGQHEGLRPTLAEICGLIDLPDALEFSVRECAERMDEMEDCRVLSRWLFTVPHDTPAKLSGDSIARLQNVWQTAENSDSVRGIAFRLWLHSVDHERTNVREMIAAIPGTSPLFKETLWHRAKLGDESCLADLVSILESDSRYFRVAWRLWGNEIRQVTEKYLEAFSDNIPADCSGGKQDDHYHVAYAFRMMPRGDAESLLERHWAHLCYSPLFVQAALYVGTPKCLELAGKVIQDFPDGVNPFKHIDMFMAGFGRVARDGPLTLAHFKNLQPYLTYFDDRLLNWYIESCHQFGPEGIEWCKEMLPEPAREIYQKRYFPSDDDLLQSLEDLPHNRNSVLMWLSQFDRYDRPLDEFFPKKWKYSQNPLSILEQWLQTEPTYWKVNVAAICIEEIGTREDLRILEVPLEDSWERAQAEILKESTVFAVCRRTLE